MFCACVLVRKASSTLSGKGTIIHNERWCCANRVLKNRSAYLCFGQTYNHSGQKGIKNSLHFKQKFSKMESPRPHQSATSLLGPTMPGTKRQRVGFRITKEIAPASESPPTACTRLRFSGSHPPRANQRTDTLKEAKKTNSPTLAATTLTKPQAFVFPAWKRL